MGTVENIMNKKYIICFQIHKPVGKGDSSGYWCILQWNNDVVGRIYGVYMFLVVLFIPLVLMSVAYSCICIRVWMISSDLPQTNLQMWVLVTVVFPLLCTNLIVGKASTGIFFSWWSLEDLMTWCSIKPLHACFVIVDLYTSPRKYTLRA